MTSSYQQRPDAKDVGRRTLLRPLRESDLEKVKEWDDDHEIIEWTGKKFNSRADLRGWLRESCLRRSRWALGVMTVNGRLIGQVELDDISWQRSSAQLKLCIGDKNYWDRGYGSDALQTFLEHVLATTNLSYIYLRVQAENERAIRCYEKCGFVKEGILPAGCRNRCLILMGYYRDT